MPGIHCGPWGYALTCQRTVPSSVLPQDLVECKLHSWGGVATCFPEKPAKLAAVLGSRSNCSSSTSINSRGCDWGVLKGLHHGWTSMGACLPPLVLCAVSQPHVGWAWVGGGGCQVLWCQLWMFSAVWESAGSEKNIGFLTGVCDLDLPCNSAPHLRERSLRGSLVRAQP